MEKDLASKLNQLFCLGFVISSLACAQEGTTSLSYTWDQPTGDFYATAQATLDYDSSYYYYVCVYIDLWQSSTDSFTWTSGVCDDEDAEQDWDTSVDTSIPLTIDLESENDVYMDYYADQFGDWPDGYCWDAYQANYFNDFTDDSGGAVYNFSGPPGQGIGITYIPFYEYAETVACTYTLSTSAYHTSSCTNGHMEDVDRPMGGTMSPSNFACGGKITGDSDCDVEYLSGDVSVGSFSCNFSLGLVSGTVSFFGPTTSATPGYLNIIFSVVFTGQGGSPVVKKSTDPDGTSPGTEVLCP